MDMSRDKSRTGGATEKKFGTWSEKSLSKYIFNEENKAKFGKDFLYLLDYKLSFLWKTDAKRQLSLFML